MSESKTSETKSQAQPSKKIPQYYSSPEWESLRKRVVDRAKSICYYCGLVGFQADHVIPYGYGAPENLHNLVCCCARCNEIAGSRFFISLNEKKKYINCIISGKPYKPGFFEKSPKIPIKWNGMTKNEYQGYLDQRRERTGVAKQRDATN